MKNQQVQCFDAVSLRRFLDERCTEHEEASIVGHLESCQACRDQLERLSGAPEVVDDIARHLTPEHPDFAETRDIDEDIAGRRLRELRKVKELLAPSDNPEMIGRLGNYEVVGVIGRGSAGIVVKALDPRLNRYVAIKLLAPIYSNNGCSRRRFEREGRAIASVKDPHVVPIHAVDDFQGTPFIVMQYLPDGSLFQRIEKHGPLTTAEATCVGMHVAKGLAAAHARGIVHRDVKPANVLLENGLDNAMVTDFGLARVVDEATMTRSGSISGTPQYMSPEQAKGERVDPRSDLFSLGSVLYAACTGHAPFKSESVFGVIKKVCDSEPSPVREFNPEISPWMVALIERLHEKEPADRFESADEVAEILETELVHMQAPTMVAEPSRPWWVQPPRESWLSSRTSVAIAIALMMMVGGLIGWQSGMFDSTQGAIAQTKRSNLLSIYSVLDGNENATVIVNPKSLPTGLSTPQELLAITTQENEQLERFTNSVESTIDVADGGRLFFRSNLGSVLVEMHDKPTVEMKMIHTVGAKDKTIASKLFRAVKIDYSADGADGNQDFEKGKDAVVVAEFPIRKLTQEEIQKASDLEDLKEQLLIRNNSHYRNAEFTILVPRTFSLDVETSAGPIQCGHVKGFAKLMSKGGGILTGDISMMANLTSHGGSIEAGTIGANAIVVSHGGHIETGDVQGDLMLESHGGHCESDRVSGTLNAISHGGHVNVAEVVKKATVVAQGGRVTIWRANSNVEIDSPAGRVKVNFVDQPDEPSRITASAASIDVGIVDGVEFDIDASTALGRIKGPFVDGKPKSLKHQMGDQAAGLKVQTSTGSIEFDSIDEQTIDRKLDMRRQERREERLRNEGQRVFNRAYDVHMSGRIKEAVDLHKAAAEYQAYKGIATYNLGCAWALLGKTEDALETLEKSVEFGFVDLDQFESDSDLDSLRKMPRFKELMKELRKKSRRWNDDTPMKGTPEDVKHQQPCDCVA
ncbi:MAG: protein kinase [Planctomycetota bacterium]